ncbi:MAG: GNAT family N-acetyltransferase, partial [Planctomycetota bacterium]
RIQTWNSVPLSTSADDIGYRVADHASGDSLGGVWIAKDSFAESDLGFLIQLRPEQSWLYCAFVESAARRRGVYQRLLGFAATDAQSGGSEQLLVIIQPWNKASMHVHRKYATGTIGRIAVLRIGPLTWVMTFGAAKKSASLTLQPARHPVKIWIG